MQDLLNEKTSHLYRRALLPLAMVQLAMALIFQDVPILPQAASLTGAMRPPELPPLGFYCIWFAIFLAWLGFAVWAWREDNHVTRRLAPPLAAASLLILMYLALQIAGIRDESLMAFVFIPALFAAQRFDRMRGMGGSPGKWVADITTGLLAGWTSLSLIWFYVGGVRFLLKLAPTDAVWPFVLLTLTAILAWALICFARLTRSPYFVFALSWGFLGMGANLWWTTGLHVPAIFTGIFAIWLIQRRLRFGASGAKHMLT